MSRSRRARRHRGPGRRPAPVDSWVGHRFEADVQRVAHGGHCVARHDGRVVFVRDALPGERVVVEVTEDRGGSFCRGDAVEVLTAHPERVEPPCRYAGPGGCGGCDWQHAAPSLQRELKRAVIAEQLDRLAGITWDGEVEQVEPLTGWRTRMQYAAADGGRMIGLRPHRSHRVIEIDECLIASEATQPAAGRTALADHPDARQVETVEITAIDGTVSIDAVDARGRRTALGDEAAPTATVGGHAFELPPGGFWQVHPRAAEVLSGTVLELADPRPGERVLDLYSGVGLFAAQLADRVGPSGRVTAVEGHQGAADAADRNLADLPAAQAICDGVTAESITSAAGDGIDVVVLDPPRAGAKREVCEAISALDPRAIVYVACDPAALARDTAILAESGWRLTDLRAYDLFPMTHHVECVARFDRGGTTGE